MNSAGYEPIEMSWRPPWAYQILHARLLDRSEMVLTALGKASASPSRKCHCKHRLANRTAASIRKQQVRGTLAAVKPSEHFLQAVNAHDRIAHISSSLEWRSWCLSHSTGSFENGATLIDAGEVRFSRSGYDALERASDLCHGTAGCR